MKQYKKAFTLVELIIVVVILSILSTVGFISYEEYLVDTRDSKRLAQLSGLRDGLRLGITRGRLPIPDDAVEIRNNTTAFLHQGYAGENVLEGISYSEETVDPFDGTYYTYLLSRNRSDFQILGFLEEFNNDILTSIFSNTYAVDYSQRFPQVMGKKLGIVLQQDTNIPLQEIPEYASSGYIDLQDSTTNEFDAYITDTFLISGSESDLIGIIPFTTCEKILQTGGSYGDGTYNINPTGLNPFTVYCDMTIDDGGWTLVGRSHELGSGFDFGWLSRKGSVFDNNSEYSLGPESIELNFSEMLIASYSTGKNIQNAVRVTVVDRNYINSSDNYSSDADTSGCEEVYPDDGSNWISPCDGLAEGKTSNLNGIEHWGYLHFNDSSFPNDTINDSHFTLNVSASSNVGTSNNGLLSNGFHNGRTEVLGELQGEQGMIFVR